MVGTELVVLATAAWRCGCSAPGCRPGSRTGPRTRVIAELQGRSCGVAAPARAPRELDPRRGRDRDRAHHGASTDLRALPTGYLPALMLAVVVPPTVLVAVIALQDLSSAAIIAVTLPLIPVFMILIGLLTRGKAARRSRR